MSAPPTVPECSTEWPVFIPAFTPETTSCGAGPNAPIAAAITASPGGPSSA